jgi:hypothetical protein
MERIEELLSEISQIKHQYQNEVPGRRRPMPISIKERVFELQKLGLNSSQIAKRTGLPYFTVLSWKKRAEAGNFELVRISREKSKPRVKSKVATVTVRSPQSTVSVVTPNGVRIEGMPLDFLLKVLPAFGVGS